MALYSHATWGTLQTQLANRLGDPGQVYWVNAELEDYLTEAFRIFGLLSSFWRTRDTINTVASTPFYALQTAFPAGNLDFVVTDRNLIRIIQYHLLEDASSQAAWNGTDMFTLDDVARALERRRDQFLADTGTVLTRSTPSVDPLPTDGRVTLADTIIDVRRAAWFAGSPAAYTQMWEEEELSFTAYNSGWFTASAVTPYSFSIVAPPPLEIQLSPRPSAVGDLDLITISTGAALDPATSATAMGVPDDMSWIIKWGTLADLLGKEGQAKDPARAAFCEARYRMGVEIARKVPVLVHADVAGTPIIPDSLASLDAAIPGWQGNAEATPTDIVTAGLNLIAVNPVPDGITALNLDVVRKAIIPANDATDIQLGREQLDGIIDYAEHLASFKNGMAEIETTLRGAENFLRMSMEYSERLRSDANAILEIGRHSTREESQRPMRGPAVEAVNA